MDVKAARRVTVFNRLEGGFAKNKVCAYWLSGRCNRDPCRFMHRESPPQTRQTHAASPETHYLKSTRRTWRNPNFHTPKNGTVLTNEGDCSNCTSGKVSQQGVLAKNGRKIDRKDQEMVITSNGSIHCRQTMQKTAEAVESDSKSVQKTLPKLCKYWVTDNCVHGDKCKDVHSWFCGSGFTMMTKLEGHTKNITGIALPSGSDKLYSVSKDRTLRIWDCNSGQCAGAVDLDGEVGCLISEGPWLFAGLPNAIKVFWSFRDGISKLKQNTLLVNLLVEFILWLWTIICFLLEQSIGSTFVSTVWLFKLRKIWDGTILAWKWGTETNIPKLAAKMKGHNGAVCSLLVGANNRLYSGSIDNTIRVWDLQTLHCIQTLHGHTGDVTSVICWDRYLISASVDNTIKVWAATEVGNLEVVYELKEECGVAALSGMTDAEAQPILFCSYNDNTVRIYDLPSFNERSRIFSKGEVQVIQIGIGGLFFTGDATGQLSVWKLLGVPCAKES
ncbi:zinc finger CCCH domain-containing protein 48-like isoform X1 [Olea europaea var. sylvestris]|uniref:zinc finger CCCH domain-containing protein 48-like isoform X1 n=1 Tax=Olea europaea var. sylvestris TaxID=158386 RepID=UPI000C1D498D|nr:zinc finger CCCH domain-containing protein 48-like isoform X1 [Olea europaea var. sylvestris]